VSTQTFTLAEFKRLIIDTLKLDGITPEMIEDGEPLFGGRFGLDSIDALEVVVAVEKRLGVKIRAHELEPAAFRSVAEMFRGIERHLAPAGPVRPAAGPAPGTVE
jgi:acyl carrier protein